MNQRNISPRPSAVRHRGRWLLAAALGCVAGHGVLAGEPAPPAHAPSAAVTPPPGTAESLGFATDRLRRIDAWMDAHIDDGDKAGVLVLVARHGRIAYQSARGFADLGARRPLRGDALWRLYSMTKPVTSVALLTLYEQGKFQLTDPLEKYLPAFKDVKVYAGLDAEGRMLLVAPRRKITVQDVFRHTAGFVYGYFGDTPVDKAYREAGIDYAKSDSLRELVDKMAGMPLAYQPGERWVYSFSHDVLARLVEVLSGLPFDEYCRRTIFEPLGMRDTVFGVPPALAARFALNYSPGKDGALVVSGDAQHDDYAHFTRHPFGGAGLSSTAGDYLKFAQMLLNRGTYGGVRILGRKTVELMTADNLPGATPSWGEGARYGLGVEVVTDPALNGNLGSRGQFGWGGFATTSFVVDPREDMVALMFTQYTPEDMHFVAEFKTLVDQALVEQAADRPVTPRPALR